VNHSSKGKGCRELPFKERKKEDSPAFSHLKGGGRKPKGMGVSERGGEIPRAWIEPN